MRRHLALSLIALGLAAGAQASDPSVVLDAVGRERIALATAPLVAGRDDGEVAATGRVLDPTPLFDAAQALATAHSVSERTGRELARVKRLARGDENASARELEIAEDEDRRARLDLDAAQARFITGWSERLAEHPDLGALLASLARRKTALARIDVPANGETLSGPTALRVAIATRPERALAAQLVAPTPSVDPVVQGSGWLVLIEADPPPAGTALVATLRFPERAFEGVLVPRAAVVRRDGAAFVYVETREGAYERRAVSLLRPRDEGWLATGLLAPGDRVVVRGAQELLGAEFADSLPAEAD